MSTNSRQGEIIRSLTRKYQRQQRKISDQTDSNGSSIRTWYLPNRFEHYHLPLPIKGFIHAKSEVTSVDLLKTEVSWDAISCWLAKSYRRFKGIVLSPSPRSIDKRRDAELLDFEDEFLTSVDTPIPLSGHDITSQNTAVFDLTCIWKNTNKTLGFCQLKKFDLYIWYSR